MPVNLGGTFMRALWAFGLFVLGSAGSLTAASADTTLTCPLPQATRTIVEPMPPGWATEEQVSGVTGYRVDNSGGQERLICEYGDAGVVQYVVPPNQDCSKLPGRRFQCAVLPPPGPVVVSDGPLSLSDNGIVDLDAGGGQPDLRLRADNPFLRLIQPINGAQLSPQGTHASALVRRLPVGVLLGFTDSTGADADRYLGLRRDGKRKSRAHPCRRHQRRSRRASADDDLP